MNKPLTASWLVLVLLVMAAWTYVAQSDGLLHHAYLLLLLLALVSVPALCLFGVAYMLIESAVRAIGGACHAIFHRRGS